MSKFTEEDLKEVVEVVCMTVLELPVQSISASDFNFKDYLKCGISIYGAWSGTVQVRAGVGFLDRAASRMFDIKLDDVEPMDRIDTFAELNNMLGGTIKSLLPEPCGLSLPQIITVDDVKDSAQDWYYYLCDNQALAISVTEAASDAEMAA